MSRISRVVSVKRLIVAAVLIPVLLVGINYVFKDGSGDAAVEAPRLLDTPASAAANEVGLQAGLLAPDFEISTTDGRRVRLSDFRGRPVVVNFHALWCASCLTELPEIKAAQESRGLDAFAVLAVNAGESRSRAQEFVDFLDAPFTFGLDINLAVSDAYGVRGLPATVFVDSEGVIQAIYYGYTGRELLDVFLDSAIDAQPPGEVPVVLRLVNTIPRDRVLSVALAGDTLVFRSRSLRCDASYCADAILPELEGSPGLEVVDTGFEDQDPSLKVRYEPKMITQEQAIDAVTHALGLLDDPVYSGDFQVTVSPN